MILSTVFFLGPVAIGSIAEPVAKEAFVLRTLFSH